MNNSVTTLLNIGPAMAKEFARAGITSASEIRSMGADDAYSRLVRAGTRPHFIGYYALVMGLQGRLWSDCKGQEKQDLRAQFDTLCAAIDSDRDPNGLSREVIRDLDRIGVRL